MTKNFNKNYRKLARNFKGRVELTKKTPLKDLEKLFIEMYDYGLENYIKTEMKNHPKMSQKEIILGMYELHKKMKGRKYLV